MFENPHFAYPFRIVGGKVAENEQDSIDDIAACVEVILRTDKGSRLGLPTFGIDDPTFRQGGADEDAILRDIERWEPRVLAAIEEGWDFDDLVQTLRVSVANREGEGLG